MLEGENMENISINMNAINEMLQSTLNGIVQLVSTYIPNLLAALAILIVGWLVALLLAAIVGSIVSKAKLDEMLVKSLGEDEKSSVSVASRVRSLTFYLAMLFVLVAFFQSLGLTLITVPLNELLNQIFAYAPRILGAGGILIIGWLIASFAKQILNSILDKTNLDKKLASKTGKKEGSLHVAHSISETVYWLVLLLILPVVLNTLGLTDVLGPVNEMFSKFLSHLPNIFSAGIILFVGWFLARVVQRITSNLLTSIGTDHLLETIGLGNALGKNKLSEILGLVVYVLVLFPVLISALDALALEAIVLPATNMLNTIFSAFPLIFAALIMLAIAAFVGRLASSLVENLLSSVGFDKLVSLVGIKDEDLPKGQAAPSQILGKLTLIAIILFASMEAFNMVGLSSISELLQQFIIFSGQMIMGVVILIAGLILANIASQAIRSTVSCQANLVASLARAAILILSGAMGLRQMGFANEIVNMTIGILFGAIGIAIALAFGLGCKEIASKQVSKWLDSIK